MIVALHSAPKGFFTESPPYSYRELLRFVQRAAALGFKAVQIGPVEDFVSIEGGSLRRVLESLNMKRNVHVGGLFDARKFALTEEEFVRARKQVRYGIKLCKEFSSTLVSIHPPFSTTKSKVSEELLLKAKARFFKLIREGLNFAGRSRVKIALESFCYPPFIFEGLHDFARFVSRFPSEELGVLLDVGHVYQTGIDLSEAIYSFESRLLDVHVHDATLQKDFRKATHLPIGKGTIDFRNLIDILRRVGYDKWLTLEIRGSEEEIVGSRKYLETLISHV